MVISDTEGSDSDSTDGVSDASGSLDTNLPEGSSTLISTTSIEPTPKYSRRGRTPKAEQLKKFRSSSFGDIADYFKKNSLKRSRENVALSNPKRTEDSPSPPNKVSRSSSSPPSVSRGKVAHMADPSFARKQCSGHKPDLSQDTASASATNLFTESSLACSKEINALREELTVKNTELKKELEDVKSRVSVIESNANLSSGSGSTVHDLERQIINNSINSVEKHIRRNNIIIRGLICDEANVKKTVAEFLDTHLNTKNCIESVSILNKTKVSIKVVLKDQEVKQKILKNKRLLKVPVYINSDLTPKESYIAKRLRDEGKKLKAEELSDNRLPKICLLRLVEINKHSTQHKSTNWVQQLKELLKPINEDSLLDNLDVEHWKTRKDNILSKHRSNLARMDRERYSRSSGCQLILPVPLFEILPELFHRVPHYLCKPIVQLRLASKYACFISTNSETFVLSPLKDCKFCGSGKKETVMHFLIECPFYDTLRDKFWETVLSQGSRHDKLGKILGATEKPNLKALSEYLQSCFTLRSSYSEYSSLIHFHKNPNSCEITSPLD
ncbi:hypothetical protein KQX54_011374 [Cotesia glomerata]|uniref:Reverse transcriptase zinc-binding domain-containing protein n=1 Tax=Cotesia glomerata TaxID=32391 RepID=A0AAV7HQX6_COTGL|nr:hypothetical protein KQX54_011374 [Cotesia glomerata]